MRSTGYSQYYYDYSPCHLDTRDRRIVHTIRVYRLYSVESSDKLCSFLVRLIPLFCRNMMIIPRHSVRRFRSPWNGPRLVFERRGGRRRRIVETWQGAPAKLQDYLGTCGDCCGDRNQVLYYSIIHPPYRLRATEWSVHAKNYCSGWGRQVERDEINQWLLTGTWGWQPPAGQRRSA